MIAPKNSEAYHWTIDTASEYAEECNRTIKRVAYSKTIDLKKEY